MKDKFRHIRNMGTICSKHPVGGCSIYIQDCYGKQCKQCVKSRHYFSEHITIINRFYELKLNEA